MFLLRETRAVQLDPQNADVLSLLAMAIARRVKPTTPDASQQLQTAETYARRAIEINPNHMAKPDTVDDATFEKAKNDKLALAHSGLGLIDINHQEVRGCPERAGAWPCNSPRSPDPVDYYLLGNADCASQRHERRHRGLRQMRGERAAHDPVQGTRGSHEERSGPREPS